MTRKKAKPFLVELSITPEMVRDVIVAWEREHPGALDKMAPEQFADRLMKKIEATAKLVEGGNA
jgi:hypothetical protein